MPMDIEWARADGQLRHPAGAADHGPAARAGAGPGYGMEAPQAEGEVRRARHHRAAARAADAALRHPGGGGDQPSDTRGWATGSSEPGARFPTNYLSSDQRLRLLQHALDRAPGDAHAEPFWFALRADPAHGRNALEGRVPPGLRRDRGALEGQDLAGTAGPSSLLRGVREISPRQWTTTSRIQAGILPAAYMSEALFTAFYEKLVRKPGDPTALTFMLGFDSLPIRAEKSLYDLASGASSGRPGPSSCRQAQRPRSRLAWRRIPPAESRRGLDASSGLALAAHLEQFGHAIYDLDFAKPVPADDPTPLIETLKHLVQGQGRPLSRASRKPPTGALAASGIEAPAERAETAWFRAAEVGAALCPPARRRAGGRGAGLAAAAPDAPRAGPPADVGRRHRRPEDVFWLTESEADELATELDAGDAPLPDKTQAVDERKARSAGGKPPDPAAGPAAEEQVRGDGPERWLPARAGEQAGNTIKGIGASPGQVTATARVLRGPEDFGQMQQGDVLVAAITTPAWTPLFALASAVVTDVGGPLSHSSIVAREYGIPAVLGTGVATRRIQTGQQVKVDGNKGVVTLLPRPEPANQ